MNEVRATVPSEQPAEQLLYAAWVEWGARLGMAVLVLSFLLYLTGVLPSDLAPEQLAKVWNLPLAQYLHATQAPVGWAWVERLSQGDGLPVLGIAVLAGISAPALLALIPGAWLKGDRVFAGLCAAAAVVIVLAASGWLTGGH